jgi:hypothetical protein
VRQQQVSALIGVGASVAPSFIRCNPSGIASPDSQSVPSQSSSYLEYAGESLPIDGRNIFRPQG